MFPAHTSPEFMFPAHTSPEFMFPAHPSGRKESHRAIGLSLFLDLLPAENEIMTDQDRRSGSQLFHLARVLLVEGRGCCWLKG
jgi:hypothetical protein